VPTKFDNIFSSGNLPTLGVSSVPLPEALNSLPQIPGYTNTESTSQTSPAPVDSTGDGEAYKRSLIGKGKDRLEELKSQLGVSTTIQPGHNLTVAGSRWPQVESPTNFNDTETLKRMYPDWIAKGFLPPILCRPRASSFNQDELDTKTIPGLKNDYIYQDWRGHIIAKKYGVNNPAANIYGYDRFNLSNDIPRVNKSDIYDYPYSSRDLLTIFGDYSTDYFKHGLQIVDNLGTLPLNLQDYYDSGQKSTYKKDIFRGTPYENGDPVIFGFEIIFDDVNSPLLNNSVYDFLNLLSNVSEIRNRKKVYEEFKYHFTKFFKTRATVKYDEDQLKITKIREFGLPETEKQPVLSESGKKAYKNFYLTGIKGLSKLVEANTPTEKKAIVDYNKDMITLEFHESVSLSVGTLAHLYKLLYYSKPLAKGIVPENLLRFNCDIIISEVRNFARIRKDVQSGNLEVLKDNMSRYIYSLRECQFYFDKMPHDDDIQLNAPKTYETLSVNFDYKYSTVKLERFLPDGFGPSGPQKGKYVGYDAGALWKVGNPGERDNRNLADADKKDTSIPKFFTDGLNKYNQNGVDKPLVIKLTNSGAQYVESELTPEQLAEQPIDPIQPIVNEEIPEDPQNKLSDFQNFKRNTARLASEGWQKTKNRAVLSARSELGNFRNQQVNNIKGLLNKISGKTADLYGALNPLSAKNSANANAYISANNARKSKPMGSSAPFGPKGNVYQTDAFEDNVLGGALSAEIGAGKVIYDVSSEIRKFGGDALGDLWRSF
jgi:hypothetical protein